MKPIFMFSYEGPKTEASYLPLLVSMTAADLISAEYILHGNPGDSHPKQILRRMEKRLSQFKQELEDEGAMDMLASVHAWLVLDRDEQSTSEADLDKLCAWTQESGAPENRGMALSNPCIEYWFLLHFEDVADDDVPSCDDCEERLRQRFKEKWQQGGYAGEIGYGKKITKRHAKLLEDGLCAAIAHARKRDTPPCAGWPRKHGSTLYLLAEELENLPNRNRPPQ